MSTPLTDDEIYELRHALPDGGRADRLVNRLADEVIRLRDAADNVNCERDMAEAAFRDANAEVERLRAENASLKTHPEGFSAETMQSMTDEVERLRAVNETLEAELRRAHELGTELILKFAEA